MQASHKSDTVNASYLRRSQIYRWHERSGATFEALADGLVVAAYSSEEQEHSLAQMAGLADLSLVPRLGFKGPKSLEWLRSQDVPIPDAANRAVTLDDGGWVARLSAEEFLLLGTLDGASETVERLSGSILSPSEKVYDLPRADSHCWFALTGEHGAEVLSKICGVDMRSESFELGSIAQTSLARVNAIILRDKAGETPVFHILSDVSIAEYLWACFLDAITEFEGGAIGMRVFQQLSVRP